ncbi:type III effector protein (hlk2) [Ralstonia solanacearum]|uniref:Type III effector protein (Hlk2) n=1 Tax=Ralstonia solanacearum TaxID=305 RepID=A0AAE3NE54_RALSL|nr:type III effector protein (hlk2) [Ralstonia solanacearum]MBB6584918.1 type III effector protein (hlk2) [Ralstonia solanacearum]MDB0520733.1 type III effector protein (hlk2) [Ralstonia solanacearum]
MLGGKITERHIQAPADPVVSPADPDTGADGSPQVGRPPAVRSAELTGLARPSVSASPDSMAAVTLRRAELPLRTLSPETLRTPQGQMLDKALKYGALWQTLINDASVDTEKQLKLARGGAERAKAGVEALAQLPDHCRPTNTGELLGKLLNHLAESAMAGIKAYHRILNEEWNARADALGIRSESATASSVYNGLREILREGPLKEAMRELKDYRANLDLFVDNCKPAPGGRADPLPARLEPALPAVLSGKVRCRSALQSLDAIGIVLCIHSLGRIALVMKLPDLTERVTALGDAVKYRRDEVATAISALDASAMWYPGAEGAPPERLTRQQVAEYKALVRAFRDRIDRVGTLLCMDAAAGIETADTADLWKALLDVAAVMARYRACLDELCASVRGGDLRPAVTPGTSGQALVSQPEALSPAPDPAGSADTVDAADTADWTEDSTLSEPGRSFAAEPLAAPANAPASRPPDMRTAAQKHADDLLRQCQVDPQTVARFRGDVIAIAEALGKDTGNIERLMNDRKMSASVVATSIRQEVDGWFETRERLEQARRGVAEDDPRAGHLADRLLALDRIGRYVDTWEADAAKCALLPKAKHLERLLEMGEIERVSTPEQLRPSRNLRNRDRVFEILIQPKRLSDPGEDADEAGDRSQGRDDDRLRPWPLVLHLHTSRSVRAGELHKLQYRDFAAVHLKVAAQKNLGRNWEEMMHTLGYRDAKVERAEIGAKLLRQVFELAGRDGAPGPTAAGPSGAR